MSYSLTSRIIGFAEFQKAFSRAPEITAQALSRAIADTAFRVESIAKQKAPVQYGGLRGSIHTEGPVTTDTNVQAVVSTNLDYAGYQEEGTGIYGPNHTPIRPKNARMLAWKKNGHWVFARQVQGTPPKWYMRQARDSGRTIIGNNMKQALNDIIEVLVS